MNDPIETLVDEMETAKGYIKSLEADNIKLQAQVLKLKAQLKENNIVQQAEIAGLKNRVKQLEMITAEEAD